jgi:predicted metalloprotease with PDZ domain
LTTRIPATVRSIIACGLLWIPSAFAQPACPVAHPTAELASAKWQYQITLTDASHQLLHIHMVVAPTAPDLKVQLPVWNALYQIRDFSHHVNWLRAYDANGKPSPVTKIDKTTWAAPSAASVDYEIAAIDSGPFGAEYTPDHLFLNLAQVLVYPVGKTKGLIQLSLRGAPQGWKIATPLNSVGPPSSAAPTFCAGSYDSLVDSPIELSEFQEIDFDADGAQVRVVVHADPADYDANELRSNLQKIVAAEFEWMHDHPLTHYLFIYHFPRGPARGGMEHAYGTAIEASARRLEEDPLSVANTSAHEMFHLWNVKRIRPQSLEPIDYAKENYTRALWFSEGVDSAVAEYILVRAGIQNEKTFLDRLAYEIRTLEIRPARFTQSVEESSLDVWMEKYPYYRSGERSVNYYNKGQIVGVLLDLQMRRATHGQKCLRDLFQFLNKNYAQQGKFFDDSVGIQDAVQQITAWKFDDFFRRFVAGTDEIAYNDFFSYVGLQLTRRQITSAYGGFSASTNFGPLPLVISVDPGGEAEKAGLRPGDTIAEINGKEPLSNVDDQIAALNPGSTLRLKIATRGRGRDVKLKLTSRDDVEFSFVDMPNVTESQKARRAAWMRGDADSAENVH